MKYSLIRVGVIKGSPFPPVGFYLIEREVYPGQQAYDTAFDAAQALAGFVEVAGTVELYYTGLTEATLGALDGFLACGLNVVPYRYDIEREEYFPISRRGPQFGRCGGRSGGVFHTRLKGAEFCGGCGRGRGLG